MKYFCFLVFAALTSGCGDIHLLRETNASYAAAVTRHDRKCVNIAAAKGPAECPEEEQRLLGYYAELQGYLRVYLLGPLPASAVSRLKEINAELEPKAK